MATFPLTLPLDRTALDLRVAGRRARHLELRHDAPAVIYPPHYHVRPTLLVVFAGEARISMDGRTRRARPGRPLLIPCGRLHAITIGPTGCTYALIDANPLRGERCP